MILHDSVETRSTRGTRRPILLEPHLGLRRQALEFVPARISEAVSKYRETVPNPPRPRSVVEGAPTNSRRSCSMIGSFRFRGFPSHEPTMIFECGRLVLRKLLSRTQS